MMVVAAITVWGATIFVLWQAWKVNKRVDDYYKRNPQMRKGRK